MNYMNNKPPNVTKYAFPGAWYSRYAPLGLNVNIASSWLPTLRPSGANNIKPRPIPLNLPCLLDAVRQADSLSIQADRLINQLRHQNEKELLT